jgi:hypothetical protein
MPFQKGRTKQAAGPPGRRRRRGKSGTLRVPSSRLEKLILRIQSGKAPRIEELLFHYAYGKPNQNSNPKGEMTLEELVLGSMEIDKAEQDTVQGK